MNRRRFLGRLGAFVLGPAVAFEAGCRGHQYAHVLKNDQQDLVGTHAAGAETFKPLIDEAVGKLLARQGCAPPIQPAGGTLPGPKRICFVGLENKSAEELGDFKDQICQIIDTRIVESKAFQPISPRFVAVGLKETRLRPEELFMPANQRKFLAVMEQQGQPFDYLLFANLTSGTTTSNKDFQRDYLLTLELVNIHTGEPDKESATIRKGYHKTRVGAWTKY
jgi:hypothetical protein